jgi:hypothetical protein
MVFRGEVPAGASAKLIHEIVPMTAAQKPVAAAIQRIRRRSA